ncbi:MAG TPA: hypothetical protein VJ724_04465, partial [Tahibacter sp.]|nr:hypothetical protein [Tahibacter sp.]
TGGMRNRQLGMLGAESALRFGESYVWNAVDRANISDGCLPLRCDANGGQGGCYISASDGTLPAPVQTFRTSAVWNASAGLSYTPTVTGLSGQYESGSLAAQPRYIIEEVTTVNRSGVVPAGGGGGFIMLGADNDRGKNTGGIGERTLYRVTSRSLGGSDAVLRVAESTFEAKKITGCNPN